MVRKMSTTAGRNGEVLSSFERLEGKLRLPPPTLDLSLTPISHDLTLDQYPAPPTLDLPPRQLRLLMALAQGASVRAACKYAGCSEATGFRLMQSARFQSTFQQMMAFLRSDVIRRLQGASETAVTELCRLLGDDNCPPGIKVRAAEIILTLPGRLQEPAITEARLAFVEAWIRIIGGGLTNE